MGSFPTLTKLRNNLGQVVHTYVPLSPSSITWYWSKDGEVTFFGWKSDGRPGESSAAYIRPEEGGRRARGNLKSHLWADCLYTGISAEVGLRVTEA